MSGIKTRVLGLIFLVLIITAGFSAYADFGPYLTYSGTSNIDGVHTPANTNFLVYIQYNNETILVGNETMLVIGNYSLILNKANSTLNRSKILFYINNYKAYQESIYNIANIPTGVELNLTVTLPPTKPSLLTPSDNFSITNPSISFDWTDSTDINGIPTYILQISALSDFSTIEIDQQVSDSNITLNSSQVLPDNKYYWRAIATDGYNNNLSDIFSFILDTKSPYLNSSSVLGGVDKNSVIYFSPGDGDSNYNILTIILNASELVKNSRIISIRNSTNNEVKFFTQNSFVTTVNKQWDGKDKDGEYVPDGIYIINASLTDIAGNSNSSIIATVIVDKTTPVIGYTSNTAQDNSYVQRDWIYVEVSVVEANEANIIFKLRNVSDGVINTTTLPAGSRSINFTGLNSDSNYSYSVEVNDIVGHSSGVPFRHITLDTVSPNLLQAIIFGGLEKNNMIYFSPSDDDGIYDSIDIFLNASEPVMYDRISIRDAAGNERYHFTQDSFDSIFNETWNGSLNFIPGKQEGMTKWGTLAALYTSTDQHSAKIIYPENEAIANLYITTDFNLIEGDAFRISSSGNNLNLLEPLSSVKSIVTKHELAGLGDKTIVNNKGTYGYSQYIQLGNSDIEYTEDVNGEGIQLPAIFFKVKTDVNHNSINDGSELFRYKASFPTALKTDIDSNKDLDDLDNRKITFIGKDFYVVNSDFSSGILRLDLMNGDVRDTLEEGSSRIYSYNGKDYNVTINGVTATVPPKAQLTVNSEITESLEAGQTFTLSDGTMISIKDIYIPANSELLEVVTFYLGAHTVTIQDSNSSPGNSADLIIDSNVIADGAADLVWTNSSGELSLSEISIAYQPSEDYYVPIGSKLSDVLSSDKDFSDLNSVLGIDFLFSGMKTTVNDIIEIVPNGANNFKLNVKTKSGEQISQDLWWYNAASGEILLSANANKHVAVCEAVSGDSEGATACLNTFDSANGFGAGSVAANNNYVQDEDYFVVETNKYSHLMQVKKLDGTNNNIILKNAGTGITEDVPIIGGVGTFYKYGYQYKLTIRDNSDYSKGANLTLISGDNNDGFFSASADIRADLWSEHGAKIRLAPNGTVIVEGQDISRDESSTKIDNVTVKLGIANSKITVSDVASTSPTSSGEFMLTGSTNNIVAPDGNYSVSALYTDHAGFQNTTSLKSVVVDNTVPAVSYYANTAPDNIYSSDNNIFIDLNVFDVYENSVAFFLINSTDDIINQTTLPAGTRDITFANLPDGVYEYYAEVLDDIGHSNATSKRKITLDSTLPQLSQFASSDRDLISPNTLQQDFTVNIVEKNLAGVTLNGTPMNSLGNNLYSLTTTPALLGCIAEGNCNFAVTANDLAGNINTIALVLFIDNNAPAITDESALTPQGSPIVHNNDSVYLNASINEFLTQISQVWLEGNWTGQMQNISLANTGNGKYFYLISKNLLENGEHTSWRYFANDSAGNIGAGNLNTLIITNRNPQFNGTVQNIQFIEDGNEQKIYLRNYFSDVDILDANDDILTFAPATLSNFNGFRGIWQINYSDGNLTIKPDINFNGTVNVTLTATDKFGLSANSNPFIITVIGQNEPPVGYFTFNEIRFAEDTGNDTIDLDEYFRDDDGSIVKYTVTRYDDAENVSIKIDDITHIVNISAGENWNGAGRIYFTAIDDDNGFGNSNGLVVNVTPVNDVPVINPIQTINFSEDSPQAELDLTLYGYDAYGETPSVQLIYYITKSNDSQIICTINQATKKLAYQPSANWNGISSCNIIASDGNLNTSLNSTEAIVKFNVSSIPDLPIINSTPITTAVQDSVYNYKVTVSDGDLVTGETFKFSFIKKIKDEEFGNMVIDQNTGIITWIPTQNAVHEVKYFNPIIVKVEDSQGNSDTQEWNITVIDVNDPPTNFELWKPYDNSSINTPFVDLMWDNSRDYEDDDFNDLENSLKYHIYHSDNKSNISYVGTINESDFPFYSLTFRISGLEDNKTYYWYVVAEDSTGLTTRSDRIFQYHTIFNPLTFKNIEITVNGEKVPNLDHVTPNSYVTIDATLDNLLTENEIEDVTASLRIPYFFEGDDFIATSESNDIKPNDPVDISFSFHVPYKIPDVRFDLILNASGSDKLGNKYDTRVEYRLDIDKTRFNLTTSNIYTSPEEVFSKSKINLTLELANIGYDDVKFNVTIKNTELGIDSILINQNLAENSVGNVTFSNLNLSAVQSGEYPIEVLFKVARLKGEGNPIKESVMLTIKNNLPLNNATLNLTLYEDTIKTVSLKDFFTDIEQSAITYSIMAPANNITVTLNGAELNIAPAANIYGEWFINISASDGINTTIVKDVKIIVNPVNDAPLSKKIPTILAAEDSPSAEFNLTPYFYEVYGETSSLELNYYVNSSDETQVICSINRETKKLVYQPEHDWNGIASCGIIANDGEFNSSQEIVKFNVSNVPDAPMINSAPITNASQDKQYVYNITASDADIPFRDTLKFSIVKGIANSAYGVMSINENSGKLTWTPTKDAVGKESEFNPIIVMVKDSFGLNITQEFNINVEKTNEQPAAFNPVSPKNGAQIFTNSVTLQWNSTTDPENEAITYLLYYSDNASSIKNIVNFTETPAGYAINDIEDKKTYYWYVSAKDTAGNERRSTDIFSFETVFEPLGIVNVRYEVNGISVENIGDIKPEDKIKVISTIKNLYKTENRIDGIKLNAVVKAINPDGSDIKFFGKDFDLLEQESKVESFDFVIPPFASGKYDIILFVNGTDDSGKILSSTTEKQINVLKSSVELIISKASAAPNSTFRKEKVNVSFDITNTGRKNADNVKVKITNPALGIDQSKDIERIGDNEVVSVLFEDVVIPNTVAPSKQSIEVSVYYNNGTLASSSRVVVDLKNRVPVNNETIPSISLDEDTVKEFIIGNYFKDDDGDSITFSSAGSQNINVTVSNNKIKLTPSANFYGENFINITASDGYNSTTVSNVNIVVNAVNDAPVITSFSPTINPLISANDIANFKVEYSDVDTEDTINVFWTLNGTDIGQGNSKDVGPLLVDTYSVLADVKDGKGGKASHNWTLTVSNKPVSSKFSGTITQIPNGKLENAENVSIVETSGVIDYSGQKLNLTNVVDLDNHVIIKKGAVGIDTAKYPQLNKPAKITLKGLGFTGEPTIYFNAGFGINGSYECPKDLCTNRVYDATTGTLSFDVPHFSTYFVNDGNNAPIANASNDMETETGLLVTLDGSKSKDINGDSLNYSWTQVSGPSVSLSSNKVVNPTFTPTQAGNYTFQLIVNDGNLDSAPDTVTVNVKQSTLGSTLDITRIRLTSDGKDSEIKPGEQLKVKIDLGNRGTVDIKDITLKVEFKDSAGKILEDDEGDRIDDESEFDLDAGDDEGDLDKDDITFTFDMPFDVDDGEEYFIYVTADGTANNDSSVVFKDIDASEKIRFSREKHEMTIVRAELNPVNVKCDRRTTASISIRNIGRDEEDGKISIENPILGISQSEEFTLDNDAKDDDNLLRKQFSFRIADNAEPGTYSIPLTVTFADGRETESKDLQLIVEGCERKVVEKKPLIEEVSVNVIPATPPTTITPIREAVKKKPVTVDFRDSNEYMMILGFTILMVVILIIGMLAFWAVSNGRKRRR